MALLWHNRDVGGLSGTAKESRPATSATAVVAVVRTHGALRERASSLAAHPNRRTNLISCPRPSVRSEQFGQKYAKNRMTLKLVEYLYRRTLECSLAQFRWKLPGILFLNSAFRDQ
jgi:hypothetical protein